MMTHILLGIASGLFALSAWYLRSAVRLYRDAIDIKAQATRFCELAEQALAKQERVLGELRRLGTPQAVQTEVKGRH